MNTRVIVAVADRETIPPELARLSDVSTPVYVSSPAEYERLRGDAGILLVWDLQTSIVRACGPEGLEWIHTNSIGVNAVATPEVGTANIPVTNTRGIFEQPMAEFVLASILYWAKRFDRSLANQRQRVWSQRPVSRLEGRRAVVIGAGGVGRNIARLLTAVNMDVAVVGRTPRTVRNSDGGQTHIYGVESLPDLLTTADDVVLAVPLTSATQKMIGPAELAAMKPGAHLVNVGRGPLIDELALIDALEAGRLGFATLDVFDEEPLPQDSALWGLSNVLVSPHQSADVAGWRDEALDLFIANLRRWEAGESLENLVDTKQFLLSGE
ncbi:MAG: D-2-hydroxyacid dehydrogenase [Gulosibacter sp.]|uniref:D-2-hydroxyacid dehydrogenase n=1 Tax=Gulosibacter sp. TaxID=2817531 RepID=UPI003F92B9F2